MDKNKKTRVVDNDKKKSSDDDARARTEKKSLTNNGDIEKTTDGKGVVEKKEESIEGLKSQLRVLMDSLATLSAEKSRMEANFQADRRQLRIERDEYEKTIKDLKEKLKKTQHSVQSEVEHYKYKLIMERHEREKEHVDNSAMIKELQRLVTDERRAKESLEQQIKELKKQANNKTQSKVLEAELEIANNKLKEAEAAVNETPPMLLSLQTEIAGLRKHHRIAIHEERKRAAAAEQQSKALEAIHEARVVGLETRLAELSDTVGGYERLRQIDQHAIQKLKDQLSELQLHEHRDHVDVEFTEDPNKIAAKIRELYARLLDMNNQENSLVNMKEFLKSLDLHSINEDMNEYKEKYESLQRDFEIYKEQMSIKLKSLESNLHGDNKDNKNDSSEVNLIKTYSKNLEERIRMLTKELNYRENEMQMKMELQSQQFNEERTKFNLILSQKESEYRGKISDLEHQLLRQRERSFAVIEEKDQEIRTLKSSIRTMLLKKDSNLLSTIDSKSGFNDKSPEPIADFVSAMLSVDNPPLLHYAQELSRREIQVAGLRKQNSELENNLRENQRDLLAVTQRHADEIKSLEAKISRLEACKSREGANLEYLKNVVVNYLTSSDPSSRKHMLNAIATVLRFNNEEMEKIQRLK
ncbi:GRIP and coiled-coil domain-containing protein 1 isoform X1 [Microplitis mediator]|uniref:GRIP and coiled-coil domain-containing protein 1 isoform X1 n=2 Tax=Microplitis mediator TaxID=375433 RepID=UPI002553C5CA|nr:GRIP and coiled-coil domain-containing protein 1 isoform X1 [Microplitis mediator]